jgi:hypothetical protein
MLTFNVGTVENFIRQILPAHPEAPVHLAASPAPAAASEKSEKASIIIAESALKPQVESEENSSALCSADNLK